jgi:hypothetical protein
VSALLALPYQHQTRPILTRARTYLEVLGGVLAGVHDDGRHAARVLLQVGRDVVDLALDGDPAVGPVIVRDGMDWVSLT